MTWFKPYCDQKDNVIIHYSLETAKDFLINQIIEPQKHIDFIISDWLFKSWEYDTNPQSIKTLFDWVRNSEETYSTKNFQFSSIPFLLMEDAKSPSQSNEGFDAIIKDFPDNLFSFKSGIQSSIKIWRYSLADDLDLVGLDPKTMKNYEQHRLDFLSYYKLKVLTRHFVSNASNKLRYVWVDSNFDTLNQTNESFLSLISRMSNNSIKIPEKEIHEFLKRNSTILKGEDFSRFVYEPHLYKSGKKYDEPDFFNLPHIHSLRLPEIFEIKLQTQRLLRYDNSSFVSKARKSFKQVKRYKNYVNSPDPLHHLQLEKYLGQLFPEYEYTLLMGSKAEKEDNEDLIDRLKMELDFGDINLVTYEELLDKHVNLCNRLRHFHIY